MEHTTFTKHQLALAEKTLAHLLLVRQLTVQANLPALASGVDEFTNGLSTAIAGLQIILQNKVRS